jgi:hypothetical protein
MTKESLEQNEEYQRPTSTAALDHQRIQRQVIQCTFYKHMCTLFRRSIVQKYCTEVVQYRRSTVQKKYCAEEVQYRSTVKKKKTFHEIGPW